MDDLRQESTAILHFLKCISVYKSVSVVSEGISLLAEYHQAWNSARTLRTMFELGDQSLTPLCLRLVRLSFCRRIVRFVDHPSCDVALVVFENYLAGRVSLREQHAAVAEMLALALHDLAEEQRETDSRLQRLYPNIDGARWPARDTFHKRLAGGADIRDACTFMSYWETSEEIEHTMRMYWSMLYRLDDVRRGRWLSPDEWRAIQEDGNRGMSIADCVRHIEESRLCDVLRAIAPNPFADPARFQPYRTAAALNAARQIRESRNYLELPTVGDALAEAGCGEVDAYFHCDRTDPTIRGSWLVEQLLAEDAS